MAWSRKMGQGPKFKEQGCWNPLLCGLGTGGLLAVLRVLLEVTTEKTIPPGQVLCLVNESWSIGLNFQLSTIMFQGLRFSLNFTCCCHPHHLQGQQIWIKGPNRLLCISFWSFHLVARFLHFNLANNPSQSQVDLSTLGVTNTGHSYSIEDNPCVDFF